MTSDDVAKWQRWKGIMKCYPFEEKRLNKWHPPYIVQPKYDGIRCRAVPLGEDKGYLLLSSEENVVFSCPHLNNVFKVLGLRAEFDGELYNHEIYKSGGFEAVFSIVSRSVNLHPDHRKIKFHVFDVINELPQMKRTVLIENLRGMHPSIEVSPFWLCESLEEIMRVYDKIIELGYEGIIVRHFEAPYVKKRSIYAMKFKPKQSDEYKIIGVQEEISKDGNPKGRLGALVCESGDGNSFNVGTGFDDRQREELWDIRGMLPGLSVKVEYQHITSGNRVPRFPVFVEVIYEY